MNNTMSTCFNCKLQYGCKTFEIQHLNALFNMYANIDVFIKPGKRVEPVTVKDITQAVLDFYNFSNTKMLHNKIKYLCKEMGPFCGVLV